MSAHEVEPKVKDLLIKLQVLTNGLIEERKKSKSYLDRIKEYEESLEKKNTEIAELTKEKYDLKSIIALENSKKGPKNDKNASTIYNKNDSDKDKIKKLIERVNQQSYEINNLSQKMMNEKELYDQQKVQLQTLITLQNQQISELKKNPNYTPQNINSKEEIQLSELNEKINALNRKFNYEKDEYERKISKINSELKEEKEKAENLIIQLNEYKEKYETKKIENNSMKTQISKLNEELNQLKSGYHNKQLTPRLFQVEQVRNIGFVQHKSTMVIIFQWNKEKNICEVCFRKIKNSKIIDDTVNILDIDYKKNNNTFDFSFKVSIFYI